jgi:Zn-dependent protease with chaperone function
MSESSKPNPQDLSAETNPIDETDRTGFVPIEEGDRPTPSGRRRRKARNSRTQPIAPEELAINSQTGLSEGDWSSPEMVDSLALASFDARLPYDRATQWRNLPASKNFSLPLIQILTMAGLVGVPAGWLYGLLWSGQILGEIKNKVLFFWWHQPIGTEIPWVPLTGLALIALVLNSWLIRSQLNRTASGKTSAVKTLSPSQLSQYSPEAYRLLQRSCKESKRSLPRLEIIESPLPLVLSYGLIPQQQTIALSRSVLTQLSEGEIAALYALEVSNLHNWSSPILSATTALALLPYLLYWESAQWGDRFLALGQEPQKFVPLSWIWKITGNICGVVAAVNYGIFAGLRWMSFWLARSRPDVTDRTVCNLTGNPNGLASALMQLRSSMAASLGQADSCWLEALEPLLPIARQESATAPLSGVEFWLTLNQFQRPIEERLARLGKIAKQWNLTPILPSHTKSFLFPSKTLRHWATPFTWAIGGYLLAWLAWGVGWIAYAIGQTRLAFLGSDYALFIGLTLLGFGLGIWMRFNRFFPDLNASQSRCDQPRLKPEEQDHRTDEALALVAALTHPQATPLKPQLTMLQGKLQGRQGSANWLGQDLWLELPSGEKINLHFGSSLGPLSLLWSELWGNQTLARSVGQEVIVSGWLRRGGTLWMDVEAARTPFGVLSGGHQIWSLVIGTVLIGVGLYVML